MAGDILGRIAFLIFLFAIPIGAIFLQIYLSKQESKLLGLILPMVTFVISLMAIWGMAAFVQVGPHTITQYANGELVTAIVSEGGSRQPIPGAIGGIIYTFFIMNIPTAILLGIYKNARAKLNHRHDIEKMSVQDL